MTKKIALVPKGYRTATPSLIVRGADAALAHYEHVFGAKTLSCDYAQDGVTVLQAEIKIGTSVIRLGDEMPAFGVLSPAAFGGSPVAIHLYVENAEDVWNRALEAGATIAVPLQDTYWGERFGRFVDAFGHLWSIAQRIETVSADEVKARAEALFAPVAVVTDSPSDKAYAEDLATAPVAFIETGPEMLADDIAVESPETNNVEVLSTVAA